VAIEVSGEMPLMFGYCIKTSDAIDVLGCAASATFRANAPGD